jgi:hypothetical protein
MEFGKTDHPEQHTQICHGNIKGKSHIVWKHNSDYRRAIGLKVSGKNMR